MNVINDKSSLHFFFPFLLSLPLYLHSIQVNGVCASGVMDDGT